MRIIKTASDLDKIKKGCVLTIGNFDGIHIGHQQILTTAKKIAAEKQTDLIVMTFDPHPVAVLHPEKSPRVLTALILKRHLLAEFGVDLLLVLKTTPELLNLSPKDFANQFLVQNVQPGVLIEGEDFNFGFGRTGGIHTLQNFGIENGFGVVAIETKVLKLSIGQAIKVSSTLIRNLLESGKITDAAVALGRPYRLIDRVVQGQGRGKQIGFPTANLQPLQQVIPAEGVYAGFVQTGDSEKDVCPVEEKTPAALSIGRAQTLGPDNPLVIEAHILTDSVSDLHGKWLAVDFVKRLRDQIKFDTEKQLAAQIQKDCKMVKEILAKETHKIGGSNL